MASITKTEVIAAIKDLNDFIGYETPITTDESKTIPQLFAEIEQKQKGKEKFLETDFVPGDQNSLKIDTVRQLRRLKVTLPAGWNDKYVNAVEAGTKDFESKGAKNPVKPIVKAKAKIKVTPEDGDKDDDKPNPIPPEERLESKPQQKPAVQTPVAKPAKPSPAKPAPVAKPKAAAPEIEKKTSTVEARYARMTELIAAGVEKDELAKIIMEEFNVSEGFIYAVISACKNPVNNPLPKLVVEKKILVFVDAE